MQNEIVPIAHIRSPFRSKFGIPRQSNIVDSVTSVLVFEPEYRNLDAVRGLEKFDYIWLIWQFSENADHHWSPTVRPPRLGGNSRMGVFATRSPFRPNSLALSSVRLLSVDTTSLEAPLLLLSGADLLDGTPIIDVKPYIPYTDAHPDARSGFAPDAPDVNPVVCPDNLLFKLPENLRQPLIDILSLDPRPSYHSDPQRVYGMTFSDFEIKFKVLDDNTISVIDIF